MRYSNTPDMGRSLAQCASSRNTVLIHALADWRKSFIRSWSAESNLMPARLMNKTPKEMREDALAWSRAGYPAVAVGRYRDAADQIAFVDAEVARLRGLVTQALPFIRAMRVSLVQSFEIEGIGIPEINIRREVAGYDQWIETASTALNSGTASNSTGSRA